MEHDRIAIFGLPIDNLTQAEVVQTTLEGLIAYQNDKISRYIGTVNTDFLCQIYGWHPFGCRHLTLLKQLRHAFLLTADGMPLIWISHLLGCPLKERVTGIDLLFELCTSLGKRGGSVYLLGGDEKTAHNAAMQLQQQCPGLQIAGITCSDISTEGEYLAHAEEQDRLLLEEIHRHQPDLLLLNLGNPKQELWFSRVEQQLNVPITMGIGGALSFVAGTAPRAPRRWQRWGFEWLYRLLHDPKRLFRRYLLNGIKLPYYALSLLSIHWGNFLYSELLRHTPTHLHPPLLLTSTNQTLSLIRLPQKIGKQNATQLALQLQEVRSQDYTVLDCRSLSHLDPIGIALFAKLFTNAKKEKRTLVAIHLSWRLKLLLKAHRIWDLICTHQYSDASSFVETYQLPLFEARVQEAGRTVHYFFGPLNDGEFLKKYPETPQNTLLFDLSHCTEINQRGLSLILKLNPLSLRTPSSRVKKQLRMAKVDL